LIRNLPTFFIAGVAFLFFGRYDLTGSAAGSRFVFQVKINRIMMRKTRPIETKLKLILRLASGSNSPLIDRSLWLLVINAGCFLFWKEF